MVIGGENSWSLQLSSFLNLVHFVVISDIIIAIPFVRMQLYQKMILNQDLEMGDFGSLLGYYF